MGVPDFRKEWADLKAPEEVEGHRSRNHVVQCIHNKESKGGNPSRIEFVEKARAARWARCKHAVSFKREKGDLGPYPEWSRQASRRQCRVRPAKRQGGRTD